MKGVVSKNFPGSKPPEPHFNSFRSQPSNINFVLTGLVVDTPYIRGIMLDVVDTPPLYGVSTTAVRIGLLEWGRSSCDLS